MKGLFGAIFLASLCLSLLGAPADFNKRIEEEMDSFYDPNFDYSRFSGRITDKDVSGNVVKVKSENKNTRFFKAGDMLHFSVSSIDKDACEGFVRSVEKDYFVMYMKDLSPCWGKSTYLRRGTTLVFHSEIMATRVQEAGQYRLRLMKRRDDFLNQLNETNKFLYGFKNEELKLLAEYERKILALEREKKRALSILQVKWQDSSRLQRELMYQSDKLKYDLDYYRIEKFDPFIDRWHLDHDLGLPVGARPMDIKKAAK